MVIPLDCATDLFLCLFWELREKGKLKIAILTQNPLIYVQILIYQKWSIEFMKC